MSNAIDDFLNGTSNNAWLAIGPIRTYFRKGNVSISGTTKNVVTRANTVNTQRAWNIRIDSSVIRTGLYGALDSLTYNEAKLKGYDGVYVENVLNDFLPAWLIRNGYVQVGNSYPPCFYKPVAA